MIGTCVPGDTVHVFRGPHQRGIGVVDSGRESMLRRQPVADENDGAMGLVCDQPTKRVGVLY
jgi:hypothetical protein